MTEYPDFIEKLLKVSYDSLDEFFQFNKNNNEAIFDEYFHVDSIMTKEISKNISTDIKNKKQTIIINGFKGCGKSTFAYHLKKKLPFRSSIIDYAIDVDTKLLARGVLINYISNNITDDIFNDRQISNKMLSVFYKNKHNFDRIYSNFDTRNVFFEFFSFLEHKGTRVVNLNDTFCPQLRNKLAKKCEISDLFTIIILWDIAYRLVNKKTKENILIIFDNLDVLVDYTSLDKLFKEYLTARNTCINIFRKIDFYSLDFSNNPAQDYTFIFILRETTLATVIEHFADKDKKQYPERYDFSYAIPKNEIILRRLNYARLNNAELNKEKIVNEIYELFEDKFIKESFFCLFNDDYRKSVDVLFDSFFIRKTFIQDYFIIKASHPDKSSVGSNGFIIRILCDLFFTKDYFSKLLTVDGQITFGNPNSSINISRLILIILNNHRNESKSSNPVVSIQSILDSFDQLADQKKVIDAIWFLFSLSREPLWNHLITFDKLSGVDFSQTRLLDSDILLNNMDKNSTIRITSAGIYFLENIITHFEYYSCRISKRDKNRSIPLFDKENAKYYDHYFEFDIIIQNTIDFVKECSEKLKNFYETYFIGKLGYNDDSFLQSKFAYHIFNEKNDDKYFHTINKIRSQFHIERVVHSHIDYLDVYRRYVINLLTDNFIKKEANEKIVNYIMQYMNIFGYYNNKPIARYSDRSIELCRLYDNCIQKIQNSDFTDFTTFIDRETGYKMENEDN